jgi:Pyruvate/2-oxoacid:ferredoxin oxidoreductase delta subunit
MTKIIPEKCIKCFACLNFCPKNAFDSKGMDLTINEKKCKSCKNKVCMGLCPTNAIFE